MVSKLYDPQLTKLKKAMAAWILMLPFTRLEASAAKSAELAAERFTKMLSRLDMVYTEK